MYELLSDWLALWAPWLLTLTYMRAWWRAEERAENRFIVVREALAEAAKLRQRLIARNEQVGGLESQVTEVRNERIIWQNRYYLAVGKLAESSGMSKEWWFQHLEVAPPKTEEVKTDG